MNFIFTSNHLDAFFLDDNDRRLILWEINSPALPQEFFADFVDWRDNRGGLEALMYHFLHLDLTGFNPKAPAPMTNAKEDMIDLTRPDVDRWLLSDIVLSEPYKGRHELIEATALA